MANARSSTTSSARRPRSLAPHEHGAYGQFFVPLATGLALGRPGVAALALTLAASAAFFAHEPVLVLLGHRGERARREERPRASRRVACLSAIVAAAGLVGLALARAEARLAIVAPLGLGAALAWLIARREERSAVGEVLAAAALSGAAFPVAIASGVSLATALVAWGVWIVGFGAATLSVRALIAAHKQGADRSLLCAAPIATAAAIASLAWLAVRGALPAAAPLGLVPLAALVVALGARPPHPRHLRAVGWTYAAASAATMLVLVAALR